MTSKRAQMKQRQAEAQAKAKRTQRIIIAVTAVVVAFLVAVVAWVVVTNQSGANKPANVGEQITPPNITADKDGITMALGTPKPNAPVVDVFFDYQCPGCKNVEAQYGPELEKLAKAGNIVVRNHPMVFLDKALKNQSSVNASVAASCADVAGVYLPFHNAIFASQPANEGDGYPVALLRDQIPAKAGLAGDKLIQFQQCFDQKQTLDFVNSIDAKSYSFGVNGTPALYVNGKTLPIKQLPQNPADLGKVINTLAG